MQTDPIGSKDDLDLYAYTGDNPVNRSDPTGLIDVDTSSRPASGCGSDFELNNCSTIWEAPDEGGASSPPPPSGDEDENLAGERASRGRGTTDDEQARSRSPIDINPAGKPAENVLERIFGITVDDIRSSSSLENVTSRNTNIWNTGMGSDQLQNDFYSLHPNDISVKPNGTMVGYLNDGTRVIARGSKDGRATLEIQRKDGRTTDEFRYGE